MIHGFPKGSTLSLIGFAGMPNVYDWFASSNWSAKLSFFIKMYPKCGFAEFKEVDMMKRASMELTTMSLAVSVATSFHAESQLYMILSSYFKTYS